MKLSKQLKAWRLRTKSKSQPIYGMSQREAAEKLGVNLRTFQDWEQGRSTPRGIALQAVLERIK